MMASAGARRGEIFPGFMLSMPDGSPVELERYRGRNNLILIFAGNVLGRAGPTSPLLEELVALSAELAAEVAQVLVVVASRSAVASQGDPGPFPILVDSDAHIHRRVGATDAAGQPAPALFVTDRFRDLRDLRVRRRIGLAQREGSHGLAPVHQHPVPGMQCAGVAGLVGRRTL
jgi:hypothetical protein